jgi:hypothetical protein
MKIYRAIAGLVMTALLLSACGGTESPTSEIPSATSKGYALSTTIWPSWDIDVCWDMTASNFASAAGDRETVRSGIAETWENASLVRFRGWDICGPTTDQRIRISVVDTGPYTSGLGRQLNNRNNGMVLNFTFQNWSQSCAKEPSRTSCIKTIAVHEFGHALGFAHEQNRADRPSSCQEPAQGTNGDTFIGAWDLSSVMNYCNPQWNGNGKLSATDVQMVQKYYGIPTPDIDANSMSISPVLSIILDSDT